MAAAPAAGAPGMSGDAALAAKSRRQTSRDASARCWLCWTGPPSAVRATRASTFLALWRLGHTRTDDGSGGSWARAGFGAGSWAGSWAGSRAKGRIQGPSGTQGGPAPGPASGPASLHRALHRALIAASGPAYGRPIISLFVDPSRTAEGRHGGEVDGA